MASVAWQRRKRFRCRLGTQWKAAARARRSSVFYGTKPKDKMLDSAATATYCLPSNRYVIGEARQT